MNDWTYHFRGGPWHGINVRAEAWWLAQTDERPPERLYFFEGHVHHDLEKCPLSALVVVYNLDEMSWATRHAVYQLGSTGDPTEVVTEKGVLKEFGP